MPRDKTCLVGLSSAQQPAQARLLRLEKRLPQAVLRGKHQRPLLAPSKAALLPRCWDWLYCLLMVSKGRSHCWGLSFQIRSPAIMGTG